MKKWNIIPRLFNFFLAPHNSSLSNPCQSASAFPLRSFRMPQTLRLALPRPATSIPTLSSNINAQSATHPHHLPTILRSFPSPSKVTLFPSLRPALPGPYESTTPPNVFRPRDNGTIQKTAVFLSEITGTQTLHHEYPISSSFTTFTTNTTNS